MKGARYYAGIVLSILLGIIAGSAAAGWAIRVFKYTSGMCSLALLGGCSLPPEEVPAILFGYGLATGAGAMAVVYAFEGHRTRALVCMFLCLAGCGLVYGVGAG